MNDEKIIKDAQFRKGLSIAFFNATNAAIEMCKGMNIHEEETKKKIIEIRDWLLEEHKEYYANVIANIGSNYNVEETVERIKIVQSLDELQKLWVSLSEDERRDDIISKVAKEKKLEYEKA